MAAELGHAVAGFGYLEDMLKRTIFALERDGLPGAIRPRDFRAWLGRMDDVAVDTLGALIARLDRTLRQTGRTDADLIDTLTEVKAWRNLLCHAVWQPGPAGGWQPVFAGSRGERFDGTLGIEDLRAVRAMTLHTAHRAARVIHSTGDGDWTTDD